MPTVEASVEVAAPPYILWELIADPSRHTEFGTFVSLAVKEIGRLESSE